MKAQKEMTTEEFLSLVKPDPKRELMQEMRGTVLDALFFIEGFRRFGDPDDEGGTAANLRDTARELVKQANRFIKLSE